MKQNSLLITCLLILSFVIPSFGQGRRRRAPRASASNGCELLFTGSDRKAVKLRPTNLAYTFNNGGRPISIADWFAFVCTLDVDVPTRRADIPNDEPMEMEKLKVKIRAFVLAVKRDPGDNDLHVQIADTARPYNQQQIVVEIPPGAAYCEARSNMMELFRADGGTSIARHIFHSPPLVEVTCYLFFDAAHMRKRRTDFCTDNGGRGIKNDLPVSPVRGIWELHPVIKLERVRR